MSEKPIHCSDGGCEFGHPGGMHTNGGCQCLPRRERVPFEERRELTRKVRGLRAERDRLRAERDKLRAAGEALWTALGNLKTFIANVPSSTAHDAFCNGVHAPDGQCEGMHWLGTAEDDALAANRAWREAAGKEVSRD